MAPLASTGYRTSLRPDRFGSCLKLLAERDQLFSDTEIGRSPSQPVATLGVCEQIVCGFPQYVLILGVGHSYTRNADVRGTIQKVSK